MKHRTSYQRPAITPAATDTHSLEFLTFSTAPAPVQVLSTERGSIADWLAPTLCFVTVALALTVLVVAVTR